MKIYVGADHRGYKLKEALKKELKMGGYDVVDVGAGAYDSTDDEVDYAIGVCTQMSEGDLGVLVCGSGHGMDMAANRYKHIRAILGFNLDVVVQGREHENANILSLPSEWITEDEAFEMVKMFINTDFSKKDKYVRRLKKIEDISNDE